MRRALLAVALVLAAPAIGFAQDGAPAVDPAVPVEAGRIEAVALNYTEMLRSGHGSVDGLMKVPLADVPVRVVVSGPGFTTDSVETRTDEFGFVRAELGELPPGAFIDFLIPADEAAARPGYLARTWAVDDGQPMDVVKFYEVADSPSVLRLTNVIQVITTYERGPGELNVQLRHNCLLQNVSFKVWFGSPQNGIPSFHIPIPKGFELRSVNVNRQEVDPERGEAGHGGTAYLFRAPIFPTVPGGDGPLMFSVIAIAPYVDGEILDTSFHTEFAIDSFVANLEDRVLSHVPADGNVPLTDGGKNPPMGNTQIVTHAWGGPESGIAPHSNIGVRFQMGEVFPWNAVLWIAMIVLIALGAALLGIALSRRMDRSVPATRTVSSEDAVAELDRRLAAGEMTTVEHRVRKAALAGDAVAQPTAPTSTPASPLAATTGTRARLEEIAARSTDATPEQLRADVKTLAEIVRELLDRR